jgi:hypothetical protein
MAKGKKGKKDDKNAAAAGGGGGGGGGGKAATSNGGNNAAQAQKTGVAKADARVTPEKSRTGPIENFYTVGNLLSPE